jgi:hypothetical protein
MRKLSLSLALLFSLVACTPINQTESQNQVVVEKPEPKREVVVNKIKISNGRNQYFIVSGTNFEFSTKELTFNVNDTIIIQGSIYYPKSNPSLRLEMR